VYDRFGIGKPLLVGLLVSVTLSGSVIDILL
jgi:hypothetical protein